MFSIYLFYYLYSLLHSSIFLSLHSVSYSSCLLFYIYIIHFFFIYIFLFPTLLIHIIILLLPLSLYDFIVFVMIVAAVVQDTFCTSCTFKNIFTRKQDCFLFTAHTKHVTVTVYTYTKKKKLYFFHFFFF